MANSFHSRPALTDNGTVSPISLETASRAWVTLAGTFGGGTATVEITLDGSNWVAYPGGAKTSPDVVEIQGPIKAARVTLAGATTPSLSVAFGIQS